MARIHERFFFQKLPKIEVLQVSRRVIFPKLFARKSSLRAISNIILGIFNAKPRGLVKEDFLRMF